MIEGKYGNRYNVITTCNAIDIQLRQFFKQRQQRCRISQANQFSIAKTLLEYHEKREAGVNWRDTVF